MLIEIKWLTGHMMIDTKLFFQQPKIVLRFQKILKLSRASDLLFGTYTIPLWRGVITSEQECLQEQARQKANWYQQRCDVLRKQYEDPSLPFHEQMELQTELERRLKELRKDYDKQMGALSKRLGLMKKLLEEVES